VVNGINKYNFNVPASKEYYAAVIAKLVNSGHFRLEAEQAMSTKILH
jgi:hypothetical protein